MQYKPYAILLCSIAINSSCWATNTSHDLNGPSHSATQQVPATTLRSIQHDIRNWKLQPAGEKLQQALTQYPQSAQLALLQGKFCYLSEPRQFAAAINALNRAEELGLKDPELYFYRASAKSQPTEPYLMRKQPDYRGAVADFRRAAQLNSERDLRFNIVQALFEAGEYAQALDAANAFLKHKPSIALIADMRMLKGNILAELERHEEALVSYKKAKRQYGYLDKLYYFQAVSLLALNKLQQALEIVDTGIEKGRHHLRELHYIRGVILYQQAKYHAAFDEFSQAWQYQTKWALPLLGCYNSLIQAEQKLDPTRFLDQALALDPMVVIHFHQQDLLKL
ncbi:hypothetical protein HR45_04660 [Shewanella mangrovi]|uniref:Uncharacterized protein n=1 Tax=Shewanella mangrovi TaxID=1515746 RepID=A0A094JHM3_9GAMM|nr:tetratricopeptide repeat protein [Shewanella mangrovi]KFZ38717.1 hypothetical protein HR45_04660 [Shewanella mangrovi]